MAGDAVLRSVLGILGMQCAGIGQALQRIQLPLHSRPHEQSSVHIACGFTK